MPSCVPCLLLLVYIQGGDKLTLNLGGVDAPLISLSPNSPKTSSNNSNNVIAPSSAATAALITFNTPPASPIFDLSANTGSAVPTGAAADLSSLDCSSLLSSSTNNNNNNSSNVTVTHFSDQRGGVVEKISVPSLNIYSHEMSSPKLDNKTRAQNNNNINNNNSNSVVAKSNSNNPFINSPTPTTTPTVSTNPFLLNASGGVGVSEVERINNNNNNQVTTRNGGSRNGSVGDEDNMDNSNVDVVTSGGEINSKKKKRIVDKNPFRDERGVIGSPQMNVKVMNFEGVEEDEREMMDRKNGNAVAEEIVTVSEIDGGRVAEIIRVSRGGEGFKCFIALWFVTHSFVSVQGIK